MRTSSKAAVVAAVARGTLVVGSTAATAGNPHVKSGPSFTDNGSTLSATVTYAGAGELRYDADADRYGESHRGLPGPGGCDPAAGAEPGVGDADRGDRGSASDIKNGNVKLTTTTGAPEIPTPGAPGCPNTQVDRDHHRCGVHLGDHRAEAAGLGRRDGELHLLTAYVEWPGPELGIQLLGEAKGA